jgi:hypothetical protein
MVSGRTYFLISPFSPDLCMAALNAGPICRVNSSILATPS